MSQNDTLAAEPEILPSKNLFGEEVVTVPEYTPADIFHWANNLVQFKDELRIELFFFNKNYTVYRTNRSKELDKQMEPIFIDGLLEEVLEGAQEGLLVRGFEEAAVEENVLQRTRLSNVESAVQVLNWLKTQEHEIELFDEETHDIKRIKGVLARVTHREIKKPFFVIKQLPQSKVMSGKTGWMLRDNKFVPFDADAALRIPPDNQLLVLGDDMFVFSESKLKSLFGYDAKMASIAEKKVKEIEEHFKLTFPEDTNMNTLVKGRKATIKKLQKIEPKLVSQQELMDHAEEMGIDLMTNEVGAIIIMDDKDLTKFVNLLNDDYMESPMTGLRYEIKGKKILKVSEGDDEAPAPGL